VQIGSVVVFHCQGLTLRDLDGNLILRMMSEQRGRRVDEGMMVPGDDLVVSIEKSPEGVVRAETIDCCF
jgi:hypothetical protein